MFPRLLLDFATELELSSTHSPDWQMACLVKLVQMTVPSHASTHCHVQSASPLLELTTPLELLCVLPLLVMTLPLELICVLLEDFAELLLVITLPLLVGTIAPLLYTTLPLLLEESST
jgi:hypothetical protein